MLITNLAGMVALNCAAHYHALALFQAQDSINSGNSKLLMIFIGIAALALLAQAAVVMIVGIGALKIMKDVQAHIGEFRSKALPFIAETHALINELTPKVRLITDNINTITAHAEAIAAVVEQKTNEFSPTVSGINRTIADANQTAQDVNQKTREQVSRVNGMITSTLNAAGRLGAAIEHGIAKPGREVAGIVSGVKVGLETLISGARAFGSGGSIGRRPTVVQPAGATYRTPSQTSAYPRPEKKDLGL
jgi:hypothetical protein